MNCFYAPLQQDALLHVTGPDSLTFLQGQTTCDTRLVDANQAVPGAYCTPKGRMVCDFLLSQLEPDHYALRLRRDIRETSAAVLGKYIVFSKAELDSNDNWNLIALWGDDVSAALADIFGPLPEKRWGAASGNGFVLVQVDEAGQQFECYLDETAAGLTEKVTQGLHQSDESHWQALQIDAGIGRIEAETVEEFVPQMLNYDITGHVNFNKGCYTGQEVVARLHYRGKSKRRMYRAQFPAVGTAAAGTHLFSEGTEQSVGNVVNCVEIDGQITGLVVSTADGADQGLHLDDLNGPGLTIADLPYELASG